MEIPTNKSAQTAEILKESILKGEFGSFLPSERALSEKLLISRNCLRDALEILTSEGIIAPPQRSRKRSILVKVGENAPEIKRCLLLTPTSEHEAPPLFLEQLAKLRYLLAESNISVESISTGLMKRQDPSEDLQSLTDAYPNTVFVLHQAPKLIQTWFQESKLPTVVFGSLFKNISLPNVEIDFRSSVRHAVNSLLRINHKRLAIIVTRTRLAGGDQALLGMHDAITNYGEDLPDPYVLRHDFNVARLTVELDKLISLKAPPTGLIIINHHHVLTTYSHLLSRGLKIPSQLSLISMVDDPTLQILSPSPSRYSAGKKVIKALAAKIASVHQKRRSSPLIVPEPVKGDTIAAAPW